MAKRGRKPKPNVVRFPCGKIKKETSVYWGRERDELRRGVRDVRLGTPLGLLFRNDKITSLHMEAGTRFADDRNAADRALGLPPRSPRAQDMTAIYGLANANDDDETARKKARAVSAYDKACEAVGLNTMALRALEWVVVYERTPDDYAQFLALVDGLDKLRVHYGLRS